MTPPIIDHRDRLSQARLGAAGVATAIAWAIYAWLWLPLVTFIAWLVGMRTAYVRLYLEDQVVDSFVLLSLPLIALGCGLLLVGWAEYNRMRFGRQERRRRPDDIGYAPLREMLGGSEALAARLRAGRIVTLSLDEQARPVAAVAGRGGLD